MEVKDFILNMKDALEKKRELNKRERLAIINANNFVFYSFLEGDCDIFEECEKTIQTIKVIINKYENNIELSKDDKMFVQAMEHQASLCK